MAARTCNAERRGLIAVVVIVVTIIVIVIVICSPQACVSAKRSSARA
jgi:Tfp pilus assembly protein PilX